MCVSCVCVLFIYTISISITFVSQDESSLIASNQQVCDSTAVSTCRWCQYRFIQMYHSTSPKVRCMSLCVSVYMCVISNQITSKKTTLHQTSVNLTPCCIKHTSRSWYKVTKVRYV